MDVHARSKRSRVRIAVAVAATVAVLLSGCQLGDYSAPADADCALEATSLARWLGGQHQVSSVRVIDAKAGAASDNCAVTLLAQVPPTTRRAAFLPLGRSIVRRLGERDDYITVRVAHGDTTVFLDSASDPATAGW